MVLINVDAQHNSTTESCPCIIVHVLRCSHMHECRRQQSQLPAQCHRYRVAQKGKPCRIINTLYYKPMNKAIFLVKFECKKTVIKLFHA